MFDPEESLRRHKQECLSQIKTYKPIHPDFAWWKEREKLSNYDYDNFVRSSVKGEHTAPPEEVLRTLDKFESLLAWLETRPISQAMTAYEKAQLVCKLIDMTRDRDLSVSLESDSFDVNLKGDYHNPLRIQRED